MPDTLAVVGVDPGLTGGLALVVVAVDAIAAGASLRDAVRVAQVDSMPTTDPVGRSRKRRVDAPGVAAIASGWRAHTPQPDALLVERVGPRPGEGVAGAFSFGHGAGTVQGALEAVLCLRAETPTPGDWRAVVRLARGADKSDSLRLARALFPCVADRLTRQKDDGRAEALLIAASGVMRALARHPARQEARRLARAVSIPFA